MSDEQSETPNPEPEGRKGHLSLVKGGPTRTGSATRSARNIDTGLTDKMERFVQSITEGMNLSDAYRSAYNTAGMTPKSVNEEASKLFSSPKIAQRMRQIADEAAEKRRMLAVHDAALALRVLRNMAEEADTDAGKIRAAELLGKAAGVFTEQVEITDKTDRSEDEIEKAIAERMRRLGLA